MGMSTKPFGPGRSRCTGPGLSNPSDLTFRWLIAELAIRHMDFGRPWLVASLNSDSPREDRGEGLWLYFAICGITSKR